MTWKEAFAIKAFCIKFTVTLIIYILVLIVYAKGLATAEAHRNGIVLNDLVLNGFHAVNVSWFLFTITYLTGFGGAVYIFFKPLETIRFLYVYGMLLTLRMACMLLVPLEPPSTIIPLTDPFLHNTFYQGNDNVRDLFFSGHTATMFMFYFFARSRAARIIFLTSTILVGIAVLVQHVHYALDVAAAPFFSWAAVYSVKKLKLSEVH